MCVKSICRFCLFVFLSLSLLQLHSILLTDPSDGPGRQQLGVWCDSEARELGAVVVEPAVKRLGTHSGGGGDLMLVGAFHGCKGTHLRREMQEKC